MYEFAAIDHNCLCMSHEICDHSSQDLSSLSEWMAMAMVVLVQFQYNSAMMAKLNASPEAGSGWQSLVACGPTQRKVECSFTLSLPAHKRSSHKLCGKMHCNIQCLASSAAERKA